MPPAVIAGGVAAAGAIGGAVISSKSQKKAASQANAAQQDATQAQLQLGRESLDLNRNIYNSNFGILSPFVSRGNVAGQSINALLGLPSAPAISSPLATAPSAAATTTTRTGPVSAGSTNVGGTSGSLEPRFLRNAFLNDGPALGPRRVTNPVVSQTPVTATTTAPAQTSPTVTPLSAQQAFDQFANSAGMQFQLREGANALNNLYAGRGALQSGAAAQALQNYGQQTALQNYFLPYLGLLSGQQATGAGAASSIAGVGQNFGNTAAAINSGMGSSIQNGANAASNAVLLRGQANANMWTGIGSALGGLASSFVPTTGRF